MAHFAIEDLSFSYPGARRRALSSVNLAIEQGEYLLLCGKSGCGKTTLLRHLKPALTPHGQRSGSIRFESRPIDEVSPRDLAARIGFVMQDPDAQIVTDAVWHELAFGLESLGTPQREMRLRVAEMASYFGIEDWFHRRVSDLSGGHKQMLNLASIMAMQPSALVLDEPTSQLDPIAASDFLATLARINRDFGTTIVVSEHRLEDLFPAADRVVVMDAGSIVAEGSPRAVGDALHAASDDMEVALPTPMRVFYGLAALREGGSCAQSVGTGCEDVAGSGDGRLRAETDSCADAAESVGEGRFDNAQPHASTVCPLTIREGRTWLAQRFPGTATLRSAARLRPDDAEYQAERLCEEGVSHPALSAYEVWLRYARDAPDVLRGLNLEIASGEIHAILGGNGAGKSTLLRAWCGIERPYRGKLSVKGRPLKAWKPGELFFGCLALLPQDPKSLFVGKTVRADLEEACGAEHLSADELRLRVEQVAEEVGLAVELLVAHPYDLAGGEQQRAALAKVLLRDPDIVLLDEPTKGLDAFAKAELSRLLSRLQDNGATIVMVSHDLEFCARVADRASLLFDGGITTTNARRRFFTGNGFYTTAASRMSRGVFEDAVTDEDVVALCKAN